VPPIVVPPVAVVESPVAVLPFAIVVPPVVIVVPHRCATCCHCHAACHPSAPAESRLLRRDAISHLHGPTLPSSTCWLILTVPIDIVGVHQQKKDC
jgi:hypothetical protein